VSAKARFGLRDCLPSSPDCVDVHTLGNIDDEFDVGVVVVVGTTRDLSQSSVHCSAFTTPISPESLYAPRHTDRPS